jgi:putative oxidoreductase
MNVVPWINLTIRVGLALFFVAAAVPKIAEPLAFATSISQYKMVPSIAVHPMALVLPWMELLVALALLIGYRTKMMALLTAGMLVIFTIAVIWAVINNLKIDCGCFGDGNGEVTDWNKVFKNTGMIILALWLWYRPQSALAVERA